MNANEDQTSRLPLAHGEFPIGDCETDLSAAGNGWRFTVRCSHDQCLAALVTLKTICCIILMEHIAPLRFDLSMRKVDYGLSGGSMAALHISLTFQ